MKSRYSKKDMIEVVSLTGANTSSFAKDNLDIGDIVKVYDIGVSGEIRIVIYNVFAYLDTSDVIMRQPNISATNTANIHKPENPSQLDSVVYPRYTPQEF